MTLPGRNWNEANLSENPAIKFLQRLGFTYVAPGSLDAERESLKDTVLVTRLGAALKKLNPWLSQDNVNKAVRAITNVSATSLIEANEKVYTALTYGVSLEQNLGKGKKGQTVRFIDFEKPENNELLVTRQFRVKGAKKHIVPDVVIFVNGIPVALVECKSPTLGEKWLTEAVDQVFNRYQEASEKFKDLGAPRLFETMQAIVVTCGQDAFCGTVLTPQRHYGQWRVPYPHTTEELAKALGRKPTLQDILFHGVLAPANLLDMIRNFVVFERDPDTGKTIRKICRYQQYATVNKALARTKAAKKPTERGGVVWHTQGSGKSLTMLWLALKLRRDPALENPTIVIVTDRKDLDEQIEGTFLACGFANPERAKSVRDLRALLTGTKGKTVLSTVQKFQEIAEGGDAKSKRTSRAEHPVLSTASDVFVLVDESHRSQYRSMAANLRKALPNACFFGFTGTPIDKKDRSTVETFGSYIDTYTIEQAVADGTTVPIFYEGRLPDLRIVGSTLDKVFDHVFSDRRAEERDAIKKKYATEAAIAGAPKRIEAICLDLIEHYTKAIRPGGFKAQVVACTRDAAVTYKETLDKLHAPQSAIIISGTNDDDARLVKHHTSEEQRKELTARFCKFDDPLSILVVCDMLLTGFDAPVEQVMYLDSPLKEHTLLQAIARVNRTAEKKSYGLVVDYWGVSDALQEALAIFAPGDIKHAMTPKFDELPRLQARHAATMRFFARVKHKNDLDVCVAVLEPEDVRGEFDATFKLFGQSLDMLLPDPRALPYVDDARWLGKIRAAAAARFRDRTLDISDCGDKVRKLIEEAVIAEGVQLLVKEISILSKDFEEKLGQLKSPEAKASEMEHALRHEIHVRIEENPAFYASLRERLEQIIADKKERRIDAAQQLELLKTMIQDVRGEEAIAEQAGLSPLAFAIYGKLQPKPLRAAEKKAGYSESTKELASLIEEAIDAQLALVDWERRDDVQREIRRRIKRHLKAAGVDASKHETIAADIIDIAKARRSR